MSEITEKRCSKCGDIKPVEQFGRDRNSRDGLQYECKECKRERARKLWRENPEKVRGKRRKYQCENREKINEAARKWRKKNPEKSRERGRKYYANNREKIRARAKEYEAKDPERKKIAWQKYMAKHGESHRRRRRIWKKLHRNKTAECARMGRKNLTDGYINPYFPFHHKKISLK